MIRNIMGLVPEDEADQPTMFGGLRKKLVDEFAAENHCFSNTFERLKVYLRVRPFTSEETMADKESCLSIEDDHCVTAIAPRDSNTFKNSTHCNNKNIHKFKFSKIFRESTDQSEFYNGTVRSLVEDFLAGQNCLVYAYGVTNAGKTYTVQGNPQNPGLLPRTLETIFNHVDGKQWPGLNLKPKMFIDVVKLSPKAEHKERNRKDLLLRLASYDDSDTSSSLADSGRESCPLEITEKSNESDINEEELLTATHLNETTCGNLIKYSVWISFAEVYNEHVFDLLEVANLKKRTSLKLGEDKHGNPYIRGLTEVNVTSAEEALKLMTIGQKNLRKAFTKLNHNSSRSHCIFNIKLLRVVNREYPNFAKVNTLSLCDLAGSERACKTNSTGVRLKESGNINTSLMTLGRCIDTMRANQLRKDLLIPYRDSKLTRLFQGFFSGRGKAVMVVNVSKCSTLFDETLQVFKFSAIAKQVIIQQKVDNTISPVLPLKPLSHMERASIPWADDVHEISRFNISTDEMIGDEEFTESEKGLVDIINQCKGAIKHVKDSLSKEKRERMLDEIRLRDEITKELMEQFVTIEKDYSENVQIHRFQCEEANDIKITKMLATFNPKKKRLHHEVEAEEEMVPLHVLQEAQNKIKQGDLKIKELTQRLNLTKKQMRRMTTDTSKLACENTYLQFQVSDMLRVPAPQKVPQGETLSDNLEQANVLSKLTAMLKSTQEKLKEKQHEAYEFEEQLQEAGETFHQNQQELDALKELVKKLEETNKNPAECETCKAHSESSRQLNPELKRQAGVEEGKDVYQKHLTDFEQRERALINGYNSEITKYKMQISQLRLQLANTKSPASRPYPTKDATPRGKESVLNQAQVKHYLLRQVRRLQDELDKNSQSAAEVQHALELKNAAGIDLEHRLAYETAGHRQAKVLISELKTTVKRLGERCRSASFEAGKTFAAIESDLSFIENKSITINEELSELESFQLANEDSFELTKGKPGKENPGLVNSEVVGNAGSSQAKNIIKVLGENGSSLRLNPKCLEHKIVNKNIEIVRLQEKLLIQSKLEQDVKGLNRKNGELTKKLKDTSQLEIDLKKKSLLIRNLEDKLKNREVFEVEVESQALIIQRLQAAVNERDVLLTKLQDGPSRPTSNESSPISGRKLEEMEMVIADLREMVDKSTKELSQKDEKIEALTNEKKSLKESLEKEFQLLNSSIDSLVADLQSLKKEKEALEVLKKTLMDELETLKLENGTLYESRNSLKKDLEISKTEVETVLDFLNSLAKELESLKTDNGLMFSLKTSLEKDLKNCEEEKEKLSDAMNSLEKQVQILKEENVTILKQKESLHSELDSKSLEMASLKSSQLSKESVDEKSKIKAASELTKSLALAKMAQKELEENLETKKKELRAKDAELTKISKLLEEKNQENFGLESKITVLCREQDAASHRVTELTNEFDLKKETNDDLRSGNVGKVEEEISLSQEEKMKSLQDEVDTSKKSVEDNIEAREKLLIEVSGLVSLLAEKDNQIDKLTNGSHKNDDLTKTLTDNGETSVAQLKADLNAEKQRCEKLTVNLEAVTMEMDRLKNAGDVKSQMKLASNIHSLQDKRAETIEKGDSDQEEKVFMGEKELKDPLLEGSADQMLTDTNDADRGNALAEKRAACDLKPDTNGLQAELQNVNSLLETERSINQTLRCELEATYSKIDHLKKDYDNEKNVSFSLMYELDDVKGSLNEVFNSFDQMKQTGKGTFSECKQGKETDEIDKKQMEDLAPETRQIVQDLKDKIKSWQAKYEESSSQLISERQKLLDAQHSQSENFYLRCEKDKLQDQLSHSQKELHDLESRQQIQQITLETDQMTKKLTEDRKKSEEQHLRDDLDHLRKELDTAQEKIKSYEELEAEVKHLQEKVASLDVADKIQATPQEATVSEIRLDEKFKYDGVQKKGEEELKEKTGEGKDIKYEEMHLKIDIMSKELAAAQKEVKYLRHKVEAENKAPSLTSTPLLDTKVGSNRLLRRDKIQAESARMKADFELNIAQEEIRSLAKKLEKFERKVSIGTTHKLESALEDARKQILQLKVEVEESEAKISAAKTMTVTDMSHELKNLRKDVEDFEHMFKEEKTKISKLEDDLDKNQCLVNDLKNTLKEQESIAIDLEKALTQKAETVKNLNVELSEAKSFHEKENVTSAHLSLEKEQLKTVVSNQTETIQALSQRNAHQELNCETIRNDLQNLKLSLLIITFERDSLRKHLHHAEDSAVNACKCNNNNKSSRMVTRQTVDINSQQTLSDTVKEKEKMVGDDSAESSDKQVCLSPASDKSSPPPSMPVLPREKYITIDVTPPVAAKALKRNKKRKPLELSAQKSHLNSSKVSISTMSLSLCRRANVSDEDHPSSQEMLTETPIIRDRYCKLIATGKIHNIYHEMSETSPLNKRKKPVNAEMSGSDEHISDSSISKGKTPISRIKSLTSSFPRPSFRGAKNLLTNTHSWSRKDSARKDAIASPKSPLASTTPTFTSSSISKRNRCTVNTSDAVGREQSDLHPILSNASTTVRPQRKRHL